MLAVYLLAPRIPEIEYRQKDDSHNKDKMLLLTLSYQTFIFHSPFGKFYCRLKTGMLDANLPNTTEQRVPILRSGLTLIIPNILYFQHLKLQFICACG